MDTALRTLATPTTAESVPLLPTAAELTPSVASVAGSAETAGSTQVARSATAASTSSGAVHAGALGTGLPRTAPEVRFENVYFSYGNGSEPALRGASFLAPAGGMTCLVGGSGSGKSTCLRLLARLREPSAGSRIVLWGDVELQHLPIHTTREVISFISQDPELFDDTLLWNLRYGNLQASPAAVEAAAAAAELAERVPDLGGYAMRVGERGARLSGGERQRVAVARALLRDAPLLLADEAASAVDAPTEAKLVEAMRQGTRGSREALEAAGSSRTLITVVHRLAAVTPAADNSVSPTHRTRDLGTRCCCSLPWHLAASANVPRSISGERRPSPWTDEEQWHHAANPSALQAQRARCLLS